MAAGPALDYRRQGTDGIYLFNWFPHTGDNSEATGSHMAGFFKQIGDLRTLRANQKHQLCGRPGPVAQPDAQCLAYRAARRQGPARLNRGQRGLPKDTRGPVDHAEVTHRQSARRRQSRVHTPWQTDSATQARRRRTIDSVTATDSTLSELQQCVAETLWRFRNIGGTSYSYCFGDQCADGAVRRLREGPGCLRRYT